MLRRQLRSALLAFATAGALLAAACGTDAVGVDSCRQIEEARCRNAPNCSNIDLTHPVHRDAPKADVDACIRYYKDACLHGLATNVDPGGPATKACVDAINADCAVVLKPESSPQCAWLIPPQTADAAAEAAPDAATDGDAATTIDATAD